MPNSLTPWTAARQAPLPFTISWSLLKLMSTESVMPSNHLILCHSLLLLPSISPSIRVFSNESTLPNRWPKYLSFSMSSSNEYSGLFPLELTDLIYQSQTQPAGAHMYFRLNPLLLKILDTFLLCQRKKTKCGE